MELGPCGNAARGWVTNGKKIQNDPKVKHVRMVFNNHADGNAVGNALQFKKEMTGRLDEKEKYALAGTEAQLTGKKSGLESWISK